MDRETQLAALVQEKHQAAKALLAKTDASADDTAKASTLIEEIRGHRAEIEQVQEAKKALRSTEDWLGTPVSPVPFSGKAADGDGATMLQPGKVTVAGRYSAGYTDVQYEKGQYLVQAYGEGALDHPMVKVISRDDYRDAWKTYLRKGEKGLGQKDTNVIQEGLDPAGGFWVPEELLARIVQRQPAPTRMIGRVTRLTTGRDALVLPSVNYSSGTNDSDGNIYTSPVRTVWSGEQPATAAAIRATRPDVGQKRIPVYTAMMSLLVSRDQLEDSLFNIQDFVVMKMREAIELEYARTAISGSGAVQPSGILINPGAANQPAVVHSGDASLLTADGLINCAYDLPEQYDTDAAWVMNKRSTELAVSKLKDGDGRYLWSTGMQDDGLVNHGPGAGIGPRRLLGSPVLREAFMPNVAANAYPVIFGDLAGYYLVDRIGFSIQVLLEPYAEQNMVAIVGRVRFGGEVVEPWRLRIQQIAA